MSHSALLETLDNIGRRTRMKKTSIILIAWIAAIQISGVAWANDPTATAPKIEIVGGAAHDWVTVAPGTVRTTFLVTNTGVDTLEVMEIRESCGCTAAPIDKKIILRGDTAHIDVSIDMHDRTGDQRREIYVVTNDPIDTVVTIELKANVLRDLTSTPRSFPERLNVPLDSEFKTSVVISNDGADTITFGQPHFRDPAIGRFNLGKKVLLPGDMTYLEVYVTPKTYGYHFNKVVVPSNSRINPEMLIDLRYMNDSADDKKEMQKQFHLNMNTAQQTTK